MAFQVFCAGLPAFRRAVIACASRIHLVACHIIRAVRHCTHAIRHGGTYVEASTYATAMTVDPDSISSIAIAISIIASSSGGSGVLLAEGIEHVRRIAGTLVAGEDVGKTSSSLVKLMRWNRSSKPEFPQGASRASAPGTPSCRAIPGSCSRIISLNGSNAVEARQLPHDPPEPIPTCRAMHRNTSPSATNCVRCRWRYNNVR